MAIGGYSLIAGTILLAASKKASYGYLYLSLQRLYVVTAIHVNARSFISHNSAADKTWSSLIQVVMAVIRPDRLCLLSSELNPTRRFIGVAYTVVPSAIRL